MAAEPLPTGHAALGTAAGAAAWGTLTQGGRGSYWGRGGSRGMGDPDAGAGGTLMGAAAGVAAQATLTRGATLIGAAAGAAA